jgi:hypothetical protein
MKSKAFVMPFAPSLHASFEGKPWSIVIRRSDNNSYGPFFEYHDKEFSRDDIKKFIPDYNNLNWKKIEINEPIINTCEMVAQDKDFIINVVRVDKNLTADQMIADFLKFLNSK